MPRMQRFLPILLLGLLALVPATSHATTLRSYTFDNGGSPDPEGWTTHDLTAQYGVYFHVENFAGFPAPRVPLVGSQSMWCGVPVNLVDPVFAIVPGYGNRWVQYLTSADCNVTPNFNVTLSYRISHGLFNFDHVDVEYYSALGSWVQIVTYTGTDNTGSLKSHVIPAVNVGPVIKFRFVFASNQSGSDEDGLASSGAVTLDDISIVAEGFSNSETFETTPVGLTTAGIWTASAGSSFGDYAGLVSGASVVQSAPLNPSYVWSFFNGSTETYACGGYPQQLAVPKTSNPGSKRINDYLVNEVRSPLIDLSVDDYGNPVLAPFDKFTAEFYVYADLPLLNTDVLYTWRWRFVVGGAFRPWTNKGTLYGGNVTPQWFHFDSADFGTFAVPVGATHLEIGLIALDHAYATGLTGQCHTQSPLFDNVTVHGIYTGPTGVGDPPTPGSFALHGNVPNPFNPMTSISYDVPAGGADVAITVFDVTGRKVRSLVNQRREAGRWSVVWDGSDDRGRDVATGVYFYRMKAGSFAETRKMVLLK